MAHPARRRQDDLRRCPKYGFLLGHGEIPSKPISQGQQSSILSLGMCSEMQIDREISLSDARNDNRELGAIAAMVRGAGRRMTVRAGQ